MSDSAFTEQEFATWVPAQEAYRLAKDAFGTLAATTILSHLTSTLITARAEHFFVGTQIDKDLGFGRVIPMEVWEEIADTKYPSNLPLWITSNSEVSIYRPSQSDLVVKLFGIRFNPDGVKAMLPKKAEQPASQTSATSALLGDPESESSKNGPPVPDALLNDWYALYRRTFSAAEDTEATAIRSAEGMFPGKSVSRSRIRALRGNQKRGPKPKSPAN